MKKFTYAIAALILAQSTVFAQLSLVGRGHIQYAAPHGPSMDGEKSLSKWWTPLPYGAEANTLKFFYSGYASDVTRLNIEGARVTVTAPDGTVHTEDLRFGGNLSKTLEVRETIFSDALSMRVPPGSKAEVRTLYSNDNPLAPQPSISWAYNTGPSVGYGVVTGPDINLDTPINTVNSGRHWAGLLNLHRFYTPGFAVGTPLVNGLTIFSAGNSHSGGQNDFFPVYPNDPWVGSWQARAFRDEIPYLVLAQGGSTAQTSIIEGNTLLEMGFSLTDEMIWQYGHNELHSNDGELDTFAQRMLATMKEQASLAERRGLGMTFATMWPSEPQWNNRLDKEETQRQRELVNAVLMSDPNSLGTNVRPTLDMDTWLTDPSTGKLNSLYNSDGLHLNSQGMEQIALQIRTGNNQFFATAAPEASSLCYLVIGPMIWALRRRQIGK